MIVRQYAPCSLGRSIIRLGKQGEINALRVEFDVSAWMAMYPDATVKLMHFAPDRPQDNPVIPTLGVEGTLRVWIVGEEDTAGAGNGVIELLLIDERTGSTIKSATGYTTVLRSPSAGIEAQEPEPGYVRYDVDQSALLTDTQKAFARTNIDAIKDEKDPTVPDWAKQPSKPTYTASEVGALPSSYTPPVTSVNGKTGEVELNAQDVGARPDTWTPSADDVGADAAGTASGAVAAHNVSGAAHADLRALIDGLTSRMNALADSDDTTLDQLSEIVAYIKSNKTLIDAVTTGKVSTSDIVDNLTTNASGKVLSAAQGVALKAMIDGIVIPTVLPNPQPITINGQRYDGSDAVTVTTAEIDDTLTQSGKAADAKAVGDQLSALNEANAAQDERLTALEQNAPSGTSGLTVAQVNALDGMFNVVAYDGDKDYSAAYQAFKSAFGIVTTYTIKNNLTNVTSDNDAASITGGSAYTATLTVTDGYTMNAVFVYMGGTDITSTAYANGVINIESVTGDIVISATATVAGVTTYTITNNLTNATSSNPVVSIEEGQAYSATITPDEGYTLTGGTISVTMGGSDVTASVYADGVITIEAVTGDILISATAVAAESGDGGELVLLKSITGDGASWVDTEFILEDSTHTMELSAKLADADKTTLMGSDGYNVVSPYGKTTVWTNGERYLAGELNQGGFSNVGTWNSNKASLASIQFYLVLADGSQIIYEDAEHTSQYGDKTSAKYSTSHEFVPIPLYLFTANATSNAYLKYTPSDCTIYFFKITDADGNVVLNLVPAKQGNKIGMYDTVTNKFHENKGTGTFSYEEVSA